jgi:hypothetical protein
VRLPHTDPDREEAFQERAEIREYLGVQDRTSAEVCAEAELPPDWSDDWPQFIDPAAT